MRIVFVTPYLATPPRYGAQRRIDGLMRGLARRHEVTLVTFADPREDIPSAITAAEQYCARVVAVHNERHALNTLGKRLLQVRSVFSGRSYERFVHEDATLTRSLAEIIAEGRSDVVNFEFAQMITHGRVPPRQRRRSIFVLDEHNIEYDILRRTATAAESLDRKIYSVINWRKLRGEELAAWRACDGITLTSRRDEELLHRDEPAAHTAIVPNAVDVGYFRPSPRAASDAETLLFFGTVSYHPNTDGLRFFLRSVFPLIRRRYPSVRLKIVGPSVTPDIAAAAGDHVEVIGLVDDIRPHLERASVVIVPLRIGGGTRFKILEAMAMGKAVVSTSIGAEGIDVRDGVNILLADEPETFATQVGRALDDPALRRRIGAAGQALVVSRYSWEAAVARLEAFYDELLADRAAAA